MKKLIFLLVLALLLTGCVAKTPEETPAPASTEGPAPTDASAPAGKIRILETDPACQPIWQALGEEYTALTGVPVTLLTSEAAPLSLEEDYTPTLFTIDSQTDPVFWAEFCMNLSGQPLCNQLLSVNFALRHGDQILGVAARTEFFGLVYNPSLLARAGYTREDVVSFETLSAVVTDITANRQALGFAAFACPDLSSTESDSFSALFGSIPADLRDFWDLYVENAACSREDISQRTTSAGLKELVDGEAVFYLATAGDYEEFHALQDHELAMLPIYFDSANQENQGLCAVDTYYWCIHANAPENDQQAALDFLNWLVTPRADATVPADDLGALAPYRQTQFASNPLEAAARAELLAEKQAVICPSFAGDVEALAQALAAYAADPSDATWLAVTQAKK